MVHKIIGTRWGIFLEAAVITLLIFVIGFSLGTYIESYRTNKIVESYNNYEIEALDLKLQNYYYQIMDESTCASAIEQNLEFADSIYLRGLELEKFEEANQISDTLKREKKRYVLLKTELWLNSLLLRNKCKETFDTVVYFYSGDPTDGTLAAEQKIISNVLKDIKEERGNDIILIPIAGDLGLNSVELQKRNYNITEFPSILINEKYKIVGFADKEEIESYLDKK